MFELLAQQNQIPLPAAFTLDGIHYLLGGLLLGSWGLIAKLATGYAAKQEASAAKIEAMAEARRASEAALAQQVIPLVDDLVKYIDRKEKGQ